VPRIKRHQRSTTRLTSKISDEAEQHQTNEGRDLDARKHEFDLSVPLDADDVDEGHDDKEHGNVDRGVVGVVVPE